jgi:hypothetical protein
MALTQRSTDTPTRLSIPAEEFVAVKGLPPAWTWEFIRDENARYLDIADKYIMGAPAELVGLLR